MKKIAIFVMGLLTGVLSCVIARDNPIETKSKSSYTSGTGNTVPMERLSSKAEAELKIKPNEALVTIEALDGSARVLYPSKFKPRAETDEFKPDHPVNIHSLQSSTMVVWSGSPGCVSKKFMNKWITVCD